MSSSADLAWQPSLLDDGATPDVDAGFASLRRHLLDASAWVDHAPGWLRGADAVMAWMLEAAPWREGDIELYGKTMRMPRLIARWPYGDDEPPLPPILETIRSTLSVRYGVEFDSVGANLYRDGRDSVAWHGDRIARTVRDPIVVTVSLGEPRRFLLRPRGGPTRQSFELGRGDLLVMGGSSQRTWQHAVPKVAAAGPRISITLRHGASSGPYARPPRTEEAS